MANSDRSDEHSNAPTTVPITSERTPLLETRSEGPATVETVTPLPKAQIALLSFTRVCEPIAYALLFPFVNEMVLRTGEVSVEQVGYYVGAIESLFSLTQMVFLIPWGYAADYYGRKPVLLVSLLGATTSTVLFGFSTKIWQMIAARCIAGVFGGNAVVVRTLFAEFSDKTNQARAFSWFAFASNIGLFLGPVLGGTFADPARQFPRTFGKIPLLQHYPYALPCLISGAYIIIAYLANLFMLKEPVHREQAERQPLRRLFTTNLIKVFLVFSFAMFLGLAYTAILPLFAFTPVELGGLGFTPSLIALLIAAAGLSQSFWLLVVMPPLDKKLGTRKLLRICFAAWPWFFVLPPLANFFSRRNHWLAAYALMGVGTVFGSGVSIAFTSVQLLINNAAPPAALGAVNGFALTLNALIRTVTPAAMTSIFAFGIEHRVMGRYLAWFVLWTAAVIGFGVSALVPKDDKKDARKPPAGAIEEANTPVREEQ